MTNLVIFRETTNLLTSQIQLYIGSGTVEFVSDSHELILLLLIGISSRILNLLIDDLDYIIQFC